MAGNTFKSEKKIEINTVTFAYCLFAKISHLRKFALAKLLKFLFRQNFSNKNLKFSGIITSRKFLQIK